MIATYFSNPAGGYNIPPVNNAAMKLASTGKSGMHSAVSSYLANTLAQSGQQKKQPATTPNQMNGLDSGQGPLNAQAANANALANNNAMAQMGGYGADQSINALANYGNPPAYTNSAMDMNTHQQSSY